MQTRTGFTTAARAETLARLLHGKPDVGEGALERAERVAHAVGTDRRRAMVWVRQTLAYEGVTRPGCWGSGSNGGWSTRPTPWSCARGRTCPRMRSESRRAPTPTCSP